MATQPLSTETSFVIRFFEDFVADVVRFKGMVERAAWTPSEGFPVATPESTAHYIITTLKGTLDRQALDAPRFGGEFAAQYYREAQYIMVALADEVFIYLSWEGNKYWDKHILENKMFATHTAGETFFSNLDEFLKKRDTVRQDIGYLYLMALGIGFLGKYRGSTEKETLHHYARQLYVFINHEEPRLDDTAKPLFFEAYVHTLESNAPKRLHDFKPWFFVFASMMVVLLMASYQIWYRHTHDLFTQSTALITLKDAVKGRA